MSQQAQNRSLQRRVEQLGHSLALTALAALSSPISQHVLAPVYGSLPSSVNHHIALPLTFLTAFVVHGFIITDELKRRKCIRYIPIVAVLVPLLENVALSYSDQLGLVTGPVLAGIVSCHIVVLTAAFAAADSLESVRLGNWSSSLSASLANASIALLPFMLLERFFSDQLDDVLAGSTILAPADLQLIVAGGFCLLTDPGDGLLVLTGVIAIASWLFNPHGKGLFSNRMVEAALANEGWSLLARSWSITGYVSVLESNADAYRLLRCDHSILGGEWLLNTARQAQNWKINEPIYSVFAMLEAVRLVITQHAPADKHAKALVIGLGIGNAPAAMIRHGIMTTIVELDPVVYQYASELFNLPANHTAVLSDAVTWVHQQSRIDTFDARRYDYIIHDVFTGGAEPLSLFTSSFLQDLRSLLTPNGVAAMNYAGDLHHPLTALVLNTLDLAFDRQCEIYGDDPPQRHETISFNNFVVFCRNTPGPLAFREPTEADFQGSLIRKEHLVPKAAQRIDFPARAEQSKDLLVDRDLRKWHKAQVDNAMRHWQVMRTVLPARVWEAY